MEVWELRLTFTHPPKRFAGGLKKKKKIKIVVEESMYEVFGERFSLPKLIVLFSGVSVNSSKTKTKICFVFSFLFFALCHFFFSI